MTNRIRCYRCFRPESLCLCSLIEVVSPRTEILILQHPKERAHAFNTARLAELLLENARVKVGYVPKLADDEDLARELQGFGLLYPRPGAVDLSQVTVEQRPEKLVVIDGTWHHARAMYREIEALHGLTHYTLPAGQVSGFRIRRQPQEYCLSTLEAIQSALVCLEPETPGLDGLLRPFHEMQQQHLDAVSSPTPRFIRKARKRKRKALPAALGAGFNSLVVVYAEMGPVKHRGQPGEPRPLITFSAARPATGERLHCQLEYDGLDSGDELERWPFLRLEGQPLGEAISMDELREKWRAFQREGDVVAAWSRSTLRVIDGHLGEAVGKRSQDVRLSLKSTYCTRHPQRGCLEEIVAAEGLLDEAERERLIHRCSRSEERLENAVAVARWLRETGFGG